MTLLEKEHNMWDEVGINVRSVSMGDPMSHCTPAKVEESLYRVKERWPEIDHFRLHLHNGRNMAIASAYAAMRTLGPDDHAGAWTAPSAASAAALTAATGAPPAWPRRKTCST